MKKINRDNIKKLVPTKKYLLVVLVITFFTLAVYFKKEKRENTIPMQIKGSTIKAEVADTQAERAKGLMFRKNLEENEGMLFVFDDLRRHSFWMKNTKIPLDIIWLNSDKEVVYIEHSAPPCKESPCPTYSSDKYTKYVLELNGGWSIKNNLEPGDKVNF